MSRFSQLAPRLCAIALLAVLVNQVHSRGRIGFRPPRTVVSNTYYPLNACEPFLLFLREVGRRVPENDRVVVLAGEDAAPGFGLSWLGPSYLLGVGQLSRQIVVPEGAGAAPVRGKRTWVACFGRSLADERFIPVGSFLGGTLFREAP